MSRPVETVVVSELVFDQFGVAFPIDGGEINAEGRTVPLLRESCRLELVLRTVGREQKRERLGRQRIRVGAPIAIVFVFLARDATVDLPHFPHHRCLAGNLAAFGFDAPLRLDNPGATARRKGESEWLQPGWQ